MSSRVLRILGTLLVLLCGDAQSFQPRELTQAWRPEFLLRFHSCYDCLNHIHVIECSLQPSLHKSADFTWPKAPALSLHGWSPLRSQSPP